jgi:hypothetical protein
MKTKAFLLLCLFMGIGLTQLSAQLPANKHGTGSVAYNYPQLGWFSDVFCDGVWKDYMEGTGDAHVIDHYTNGVWDWEIITFSGNAKSFVTGETFTFKEQDKLNVPVVGGWTCHANIKGDKGTLYNISFVMTTDGVWHLKNATCTGNTK